MLAGRKQKPPCRRDETVFSAFGSHLSAFPCGDPLESVTWDKYTAIMAKSPKNELRELHYKGHVQGVFFRATARNIASGLAVTGYVMNLPDGRVKLVAEGAPAELDLLERSIAQEKADSIQDVQRDTRPATGHYDTFEIRY